MRRRPQKLRIRPAPCSVKAVPGKKLGGKLCPLLRRAEHIDGGLLTYLRLSNVNRAYTYVYKQVTLGIDQPPPAGNFI